MKKENTNPLSGLIVNKNEAPKPNSTKQRGDILQVTLNLKIDASIKKQMKQTALDFDTTITEIVLSGFELWKKEKGRN